MKHTNSLSGETSLYLLQHAHNPVNWLPYGTEALETARALDKPLLISIGYSSCHWCHVMAHESFEDEEVARLMNANFICVKVDREERPDVDHAFMDAVQQIRGNGGWPLNCFALPDGRAFWGGTYFRRDQWMEILQNVTDLFVHHRSDLVEQAEAIAEGLKPAHILMNLNADGVRTDLQQAYARLYSRFDHARGGLQGAPKFPMPPLLGFLLDYSQIGPDSEAGEMLGVTLRQMACGGIFDQAGGGFARYSTDADWKVPHFEKMLYDNALLIQLYSRAFLLNPDPLYRDVVTRSIEFVQREMRSPEGYFYSALDADTEGGEGAFYTWSAEEIQDALGPYAALASEYYGVGTTGLWEDGRNILLRPASDALFAQQHFLSDTELSALLSYCRNQLLRVRSDRPAPAADDKLILAWNALMVKALAKAALVFGNDDFAQAAEQTATFLLSRMKAEDGGLLHSYKNSLARIPAFLDDYAFTCSALTELFSLTAQPHWLSEALRLTDYVIDHFYDSHSGLFWFSVQTEDTVFQRKLDTYDGVIPSGNSEMARVLRILSVVSHEERYAELYRGMLSVMGSQISENPAAFANWAGLALEVENRPYVAAVVGPDAVSLVSALRIRLLDRIPVFGCTEEDNLPLFRDRYQPDCTRIFICSDTYCMEPVSTVEEAAALLSEGRKESEL
jgi:uncharacterized protein